MIWVGGFCCTTAPRRDCHKIVLLKRNIQEPHTELVTYNGYEGAFPKINAAWRHRFKMSTNPTDYRSIPVHEALYNYSINIAINELLQVEKRKIISIWFDSDTER